MKNLFSLKLVSQLLTVTILASSVHSFAQTIEKAVDPYTDWYQVEFIVFKNLDGNARQQEQWPTQKQLTLTKDTQSLNELLNIPLPRALQLAKEADELTRFRLEQELSKPLLPTAQSALTDKDAIDMTTILIDPTTIAQEPIDENAIQAAFDEEKQLLIQNKLASMATFIPATAEQLVLKHQAKQLKYNRKYKVIYHGAWQQKLSDGQPMTSYRLAVETDGNLLDGTINIIRKRFLHVATDFWMHEIAIDTAGIDSVLKQEKIQPFDNKHALTVETDNTNVETIEAIEYARLYKRERMKSNDLHYIDHPLMGMLIQITPFNQLKHSLSSVETAQKTK